MTLSCGTARCFFLEACYGYHEALFLLCWVARESSLVLTPGVDWPSSSDLKSPSNGSASFGDSFCCLIPRVRAVCDAFRNILTFNNS